MKRLPKENEYQLDIKDQFKNEFEIGQLQGNNFHMTDSADLPMLIEPQGNIEQEVIEAIEGIVVEGSNINVNDVDTNYEDSIVPKGNIEQDSRVGYNLIDLSGVSNITQHGITVTNNNNNGTLTVNGTSTANATIVLKLYFEFPFGEETTLMLETEGTIDGSFQFGFNELNSKNEWVRNFIYLNNSNLILNIPSDKVLESETNHLTLFFYVKSGTVLTNFKLKPMLVKGKYTESTKPPFEQYGSMPSIAFPSEVKGVGGHYDTKIENKNICSEIESGNINSSGANYEDTTSIRSKNYDLVQPNSSYIASKNGLVSTFNISEYDKNKTFIKRTYYSNGLFTTSSTTKYVKIQTTGSITDKIQLEVGTVVTPYIEHQEQTLPIDIPFNMYSGKPYKENGKWYRKVEWNKEYLTTSSTIYTGPTNTTGKNRFTFKPTLPHKVVTTSSAIVKEIYCNILKNGSPDASYLCRDCVTYDGNVIIIYLEECCKMNWQEFREFCEENNVYIVYELATPIKEEITDTTLIAQLEALEKAELYDGVTNINTYSSSENIADLPIEAHYNFVTPSPSVDRPSEVLEVGSEEDINKIGNATLRSTGRGVTLTNNEDGSFTLNGTSTDSIYIDFETNIKEAGDYKVAFNKNQLISSFGGDVRLVFKKDDTSINDTTLIGKQNYNLTFAENNLPNRSYVWLNKGNVFDNFTFYPSITKGTEIKPYTPYGYCRYETIVGNKNFLKLKEDSVINGVNFTNLENGYFKLEGTPTKSSITISDYFKVKGKINASLEILEGSIESLWFWNKTDSETIITLSGQNLSKNIEYDSNKEIACCVSCTIGTPIYFVARVQVEQGDTKTNQVAHREQLFPIDLPIGMKMYNDEFFYKENGKWWRNIKYVKSKLTSDMEWYLEVFDGIGRPRTNYFADVIKNVSAVNTVRVYSNYFKQNYGNNDYVFGNLKVGYLGFYTNKLLYLTTYFKNVNDWKTYLDENDVYIVFEIEPYPEEITDANLIAQLEKTLTPFSYYPVTNINSYRPTTNVADLKLYAEYFKSNKITNK